MARIVVFSLCLLLTVRSIACIECYSCISTENPDCIHPEQHMERQKCNTDGLRQTSQYASKLSTEFKEIFDFPTIGGPIPLNCLKQVVKVEGTEVVFRGCQLPKDPHNQLDVCNKVLSSKNKNNVHVMFCALCDTDGCNGAPHTRPSLLAAVGALLLGALMVAF
ncbi:uncharacterized protein [Atheta coriaria]|uniref:uncharacterized protein n=1 Tax=Dalotia coriaria TaxID=877792 RepID=UPI0031F3AF71